MSFRFIKILSASFPLLLLNGFLQFSVEGADRPNIVWITSEDHGPHLGAYGEPLAQTPALDQLASEGVIYSHAFSVAGVCAPARSSIITGHYPNHYGGSPMRSSASLPPSILTFSSLLKSAGYWCTNNIKEDYNFPTPSLAWDATGSYNRSKAHWRHRPEPGQPFFAVFNFLTTHESRHRSNSEYLQEIRDLPAHLLADPAEVLVPPYLPDTPLVRRDLARNLDLIAALDRQVGAVLAELEADGLTEETIVFFFSDHGDGLPRSKRWVYDSGLRVPMIVRIPEKWRIAGQGVPATVDSQLISFVDLAPSMLNLAGLEIPANLPGRPFLGQNLPPQRSFAFAFRDRTDESFDTIRAVRDGRYKYIRNYRPWEIPLQQISYSESVATASELRRLAATRELPAGAAHLLGPGKVYEELYDLHSDPHEVNNLINHPSLMERQRLLSEALDAWMLEIRDLGVLPEGLLHRQLQSLLHETEVFAGVDGLARFQRIEETARMAANPQTRTLEDLWPRLADPDPAVRYWAALGCAALHPEAVDALTEDLLALLEDPSFSVRTASASALLKTEHFAPQAVAALIPILQNGLFFEQLEAAAVIEKAGNFARPWRAELESANALSASAPYTYLGRTLTRVVQLIRWPESLFFPPTSFRLDFTARSFSWWFAGAGYDRIETSSDARNWTPLRSNMTGVPGTFVSFPLPAIDQNRLFRIVRSGQALSPVPAGD